MTDHAASSRASPLLAPVIAVLIAMLATSVVIVLTNSGSGVSDFWRIILTKPENRIIVNIVNQSGMIYLSAVAAAIGFRMGLFNIGVEGQYTLASYAAATFAGAALPARLPQRLRHAGRRRWSSVPCGPASPACCARPAASAR